MGNWKWRGLLHHRRQSLALQRDTPDERMITVTQHVYQVFIDPKALRLYSSAVANMHSARFWGWFYLGAARVSSRVIRDVTKAEFLLHFGSELGQLHLMQRQTMTKIRGSCVQTMLTHKNLSSFQKPQSMQGTHALSYIKEQCHLTLTKKKKC